ncbi:MAG: 6-phosphogluconolactonase [Actinomycetota bacterium]|nr:6-phosphogluconolactonase [Actinomycetota bacterium]
MPAEPTLVVHRSAELLAQAAAARLVTRLVDAQSSGRVPSLVLTGGSIAARTYAAVADSPAHAAVDWGRVELWWGDERFLPAGDPDRNETQARAALLDRVPVDPDRVHPMPASDGRSGDDPDQAAADYAEQLRLAARPEDHGQVPTFDVLLLGVGPDAHVASLFPEHPGLYDDRAVTAVRGAPKPPPTRLSMTFPTLGRAREVWFLVAGEDKARAVRLALSGAGPMQVPAAGVRGRQHTLWLLEKEAAREVPSTLARAASP